MKLDRASNAEGCFSGFNVNDDPARVASRMTVSTTVSATTVVSQTMVMMVVVMTSTRPGCECEARSGGDAARLWCRRRRHRRHGGDDDDDDDDDDEGTIFATAIGIHSIERPTALVNTIETLKRPAAGVHQQAKCRSVEHICTLWFWRCPVA